MTEAQEWHPLQASEEFREFAEHAEAQWLRFERMRRSFWGGIVFRLGGWMARDTLESWRKQARECRKLEAEYFAMAQEPFWKTRLARTGW